MEIVFYLIPLALIILAIAVRSLFWAVSNKQFDDLEKEATRILFDDLNTEKEEKHDARNL